MEIARSESALLRRTTPADLEYVTTLERGNGNDRFIDPWDAPQHARALSDPDKLHVIVASVDGGGPLGFVLLAGLDNAHRSVELKRIVVGSKGKGHGRRALRLVTDYAFQQLRAHRLWLDVKDFNQRARTLYRSEGFVEEGLLRECMKGRDGYDSLVVMSMLESDYESA